MADQNNTSLDFNLQPLVDQFQEHHIAGPSYDDSPGKQSPTDDAGDEFYPSDEEDKAIRKFAPATKKRKRTPSKPSSTTRTRSKSKSKVTSPSSSTALPPAMPRKSAASRYASSAIDDDTDETVGTAANADVTTPLASVPLPNRGDPIPTDVLLTLSTADFDVWFNRLNHLRDLTSEEESTIRLVRRRIRNRESARDSRSNKKNYLQSLQSQVDELKNNNHDLSLQMSSLKSENAALKEEANYLQDMIKTTPGMYCFGLFFFKPLLLGLQFVI